MNIGEWRLDCVKNAPLAKIELGGGESPLFHPNFDIYPHPNVDEVCDITKGIPLPDDSANRIYSKDFAEHITFSNFIDLLKECKRVLVVRGAIEFIVPDVERAVATNDTLNVYFYHSVVGKWDKERPELRHKMWYTPSLIRYILCHEGWSHIRIEDYKTDIDWWKEPKMRVVARK